MSENYYVKNKKKFMRKFKTFSKSILKVLTNEFGKEKAKKILKNSIKNYEELLPKIPYIGGSKNKDTTNLIMGAIILSVILELEKENLDENEIGRIVYIIFQNVLKKLPAILGFVFRIMLKTKAGKKKLAKRFDSKDFYKYDSSWQSESVYGEDFDFGINYHSCGICDFYKELGYSKYTHYVCLSDYEMFKNLNVHLKRTKTLANGADGCDFRFSINKDKKFDSAWPPQKLEEWKQ